MDSSITHIHTKSILLNKRRPGISFLRFFSTCLLVLCFQVKAEAELDNRFEAANKAYIVHAYEEAVELYTSLVDEGKVSASLYFNLGNAHYKLGNVAESVLNYERALRLDPGFDDAVHNLKMANLKVIDNIDPLPELLLVSWAKSFFQGMSSRQWAIVSVGIFWLALLAAAGFLFINIPIVKKIGFFGGFILLFFGLVSIGLSYARKQSEENTRFGIISQSTAYIKNAPDGDQDLLILHEGAKVEILEITGDWNKIQIKGVGIDVVGFVKGAEITGI